MSDRPHNSTSYGELVSELFGSADSAQRKLPADELELAERRLGRTLPAPLRRYYLDLGGFRELNLAHDRVIYPRDLEREGDFLPFYEENQVVCRWAIPFNDSDSEWNPLVYQGTYDKHWVWADSGISLSEFIKIMIFIQCVWGAFSSGRIIPNADEVVNALGPEWIKVADYLELRIWRKEAVLLSRLGDEPNCVLSANADEQLEQLRSVFPLMRPAE